MPQTHQMLVWAARMWLRGSNAPAAGTVRSRSDSNFNMVEVEDMKKGLNTLNKMDTVRASSISIQVEDSVEQVEKLDSSLSSQVHVYTVLGFIFRFTAL